MMINIDLSQELFAVDVFTALKSSLEDRRQESGNVNTESLNIFPCKEEIYLPGINS